MQTQFREMGNLSCNSLNFQSRFLCMTFLCSLFTKHAHFQGLKKEKKKEEIILFHHIKCEAAVRPRERGLESGRKKKSLFLFENISYTTFLTKIFSLITSPKAPYNMVP